MPNTKTWIDPDGQVNNTGTSVQGMYIVNPTTRLAEGLSGTSITQGPGAPQGTQWNVKGDYAELSGLSAGSLNADLVPSTDVSAYNGMSLHVTGVYSGTLSFQGSNDSSSWYGVNCSDIDASALYADSTSSTNKIFFIPRMFRYLRVRMTSYTSGTANGVLELYTISPIFIPRSVTDVSATQSGTWGMQPYPPNSTPQTNSSGNVANAVATATLTGASGKTTYVSGFEITGSGATAGLPVVVTLTGVLGGTMRYIYSALAGVLIENTPLIVEFSPPIPSSAVNTNIVVSCPALGVGNTNNVANIRGYTL